MKHYHKNYYGALLTVFVIIVATGLLLQNYGSDDLVAMAVTHL